MVLFTGLYQRMLALAASPLASRYLAGLSFAESSFFPLPPDVMLLPMSVARPDKAMRYALITTVASVLGGLFGYAIGYFGFELIQPLLIEWGYEERFLKAVDWFEQFGFWIVFVAGFSPVPYKVITIAAGTAHIALLPFILASIIGRAARFYLVAFAGAKFGPKAEPWIRKNVEPLGWLTIGLLVAAIAWVSMK